MKRKASMAFVLALCTALAMSGAVAAKDHPAHGASGPHVGGHGSGSVAASLKTKGNASHPGGVFRVLAVLHAPKDLRPPTINAVVHFVTGDVALVLTRSGKGAAYHGNVVVPAAEPAGIVKIDATAVVNGATLTATGSGKIIVEKSETSETTSETSETTSETSETSTTSTETSATCTVTTTATVTTTVTTTASETSTTTETSDSSESSEASESSDSSESSDASEPSEASESSDADDSDSCNHESADSHSFGMTSQSITEFFALVASLIN